MSISTDVKKQRGSTSDATSITRILSSPTRYSLIEKILGAKRDLCVYELAEAIGLSQSATSHQLAFLEARGVVRGIRLGKTKCYIIKKSSLTAKIAKVINILK